MSLPGGLLEDNPELESTLDRAKQWYHVPALLLVVGFMLWNRVRNYSNFIVDGQVVFSGQDPWYHYRSTMYVVRNWPATMPFDPWTQFPYGTSTGQFGTLMDQFWATVALIVGLGSPTEQTVGMVALVAPAIMGAMAAIPTYFVGRRLGGRFGGVTAIVVLGLSAGTFLQRSLVGVYDHQVAEGLLQVTAVLAVMVALSVAERDKPIYEQFVDRDVAALRAPVAYAVLAGFAIALYLWTWPPAVLLLGILGVFFLLWLTLEFLRGNSPEHTAIVGAVMMGSVLVFALSSIQTFEITATNQSLLQPLMALVIGSGCVFMAWLARYMEAEEYDRQLYPVTVGGIIVVVTVLMAILTPDLFSYFIDQLLRVVGFTSSPSARAATVAEATPLRNPSVLFQYYGLSLFVAILGAGLILFKQFRREASAEEFLMVVWFAFILAANLTQVRFGVYTVFPVAALTAWSVHWLITVTGFTVGTDIEVYEVLTVSAIALAIVGTLVLVGPTAVATGSFADPGQEPAAWNDGLDWLEENSPEEGQFGPEGNTSMEYYGTYKNTDDYDYPAGAFGVLSWWDYGHLITVQGERIPVANPFQQGATEAANFLLAPTEAEANDVIDTVGEDDASTRFVAVDWKMANTYGQLSRGKFFAPTEFESQYNASRNDYYRYIYTQNGQQRFTYRTQRYYNSTVVRLYQYHGSAMEPQPVVLDWEVTSTQQGQRFRAVPSDGSAIRSFDSIAQARAYAEQDGTAQVGGFGALPSERVPALEHYRYVGSSEQSAYSSGDYNRGTLVEASLLGIYQPQTAEDCGANATAMPISGTNFCMSDGLANVMSTTNPAWTKIFERVPGATIDGTGPANTTVEASVEMVNQETGETFTYTQRTRTDSEGNFEMTVPYSTTGYDEYGTDAGYTNVSVRAEGPYEFGIPVGNGVIPLDGTASVSEGQVIGEDDSASTVSLSVAQNQPEPENETTVDGGSTDGGSSDGTSTDDGSTVTATPSSSLAGPSADVAQ